MSLRNVVESNFGLSAMLVGTHSLFICCGCNCGSNLSLFSPLPKLLRTRLAEENTCCSNRHDGRLPFHPLWHLGLPWYLMPSVEYWGKLINKYLGWIPLFEVKALLSSRAHHSWLVFVLAIMIIPIITSVSREIFAQAPLDRIQAAFRTWCNSLGNDQGCCDSSWS